MHIDPRGSQGREEFPGDAGRVPHPLSHDRENRKPLLDGRVAHQPRLPLPPELSPQSGPRPLRVGAPDREGQGVRARVLREEKRVHVGNSERTEDPLRGLRNADRLDPCEPDQRHVPGRGNPAHRPKGVPLNRGHDQRPREGRIEGAADSQPDPGAPGRLHRRGADHLCAEVGELEELRVGDLARRGGFGHGPRIRGEHPVHVRPDLDLRRAQHRAEKGGGVVGRAPAQGGRLPFRRRGDEPGDDRDSGVPGKPRAHQLPRPLPIHPRRAEAGVGPEKLPCVHVDRGDPMGAHAGGDEQRGETFPEGEHPVARPGGAFAEKLGPVRKAPEVVHRRIEAEGEARRFVGRSEGVEKLPVHLRDLPRHRRMSGVPPSGEFGDLDQPVRRSVHRGDDHDRGGAGPGVGDKTDDAPDARGASDRGPPELHHPNRRRDRTACVGRSERGSGGHEARRGRCGRSNRESRPAREAPADGQYGLIMAGINRCRVRRSSFRPGLTARRENPGW